jgi:hypothetical protein
MTPGQAAYEAFIRGADDRLAWHQLSSWVQARWERVAEAGARIAEERIHQRYRQQMSDAAEGRTSPTQLGLVK